MLADPTSTLQHEAPRLDALRARPGERRDLPSNAIDPLHAIVVEGGAMRGIYAAGVLDEFTERGFHPFGLAVGASAGACNLSSHLAGNLGRNRRCFFDQMRRPEFVDGRRYLRGGHWMDIDWLWDAFNREDPLDTYAAAAHPTTFVIAATSVRTGEPTWFIPDGAVMNEVLRASSAVPMMFRRYVDIDGERYFDGGVGAPIPVEEAYKRGARKIVVIRSRPRAFGGPSRLESLLVPLVLRDAPGIAKAFRAYRDVYAKSVAFLRNPPADCTVIEVVPDEHLRTGRTTRDLRSLRADYALGRRSGIDAIRRWNR
ncbi:MAG TPA: patatin family protein [Kofleriaceae bacterium]|jgi:predicted patatin/cPLA2 family phospholipase